MEVRRASSVYAGLVLAASIPLLLRLLCGCDGHPSPGATLASILLMGFVLGEHELIHYAAARLIGVPGLRVRLHPRLAALILEYDEIKPVEYAVVALAPQMLTVALLVLAVRSPQPLPFCLAAVVNIAGGMIDIVNAVYFGLFHRGAARLKLLYDERGSIAGGVVEYKDRIIVYML